MPATRRSFFGFLFGAAAAAPVLPEIVEAKAAPLMMPVPLENMPASLMPGHITYIGRNMTAFEVSQRIAAVDFYPGGLMVRDLVDREVRTLRKFYRGVPIEEVESFES